VGERAGLFVPNPMIGPKVPEKIELALKVDVGPALDLGKAAYLRGAIDGALGGFSLGLAVACLVAALLIRRRSG
jgi:hypothetical protein